MSRRESITEVRVRSMGILVETQRGRVMNMVCLIM